MSELVQKKENCDFRWQLLAGVSVLTLMGSVAAMGAGAAEESDRPTVWIELGGQLTHLENNQDIYSPSFTALTPSNFSPPQKNEKPPSFGWGESAALRFQPKGSDWTFSASMRYGRSSNQKHVRQQSYPTYTTTYTEFRRSRYGVYHHFKNYFDVAPRAARFADTATKYNESHTILDFQAGKDLGIGLFGRDALSTLNVGARFAQFTSKASIALKENPDWQFKTKIVTFSTSYGTGYYHYSFYQKRKGVFQPYHSFPGTFRATRSFTGLGPSISWDSSIPFLGNADAGELTLDFGANAALLFGRQKAKTHHQTTALYQPATAYFFPPKVTVYEHNGPTNSRSYGVAVPNIGAFAGFSVKYPNAKVSFGYKADFFFGAMDGGIDVRRTEDVGFHGPYASVSIGLGG